MRRASAVLGSMILAAWAAAAQAQVDTAMVHVGPQDGGTEAFVSWPAGTSGSGSEGRARGFQNSADVPLR